MSAGTHSLIGLLIDLSSPPRYLRALRLSQHIRPSLVVQDFDGVWRRLGRAFSRRWSNHYSDDGSGFGYLTFSLHRKIGYDYRDIAYNYRVQLRKYLSKYLFDGQIRKITENETDPNRLDITCLGWNVVAEDDTYNRIFCDTRYMRWKGSEEPSGSFTPDKFDYSLEGYIQFKPRRGVDYSANDYTRVRYTFPFGEVAERIEFDYSVALPDSWPGKLEVRDSNGAVLWSQTASGSGTDQSFSTSSSPTYFEVRFYTTSAGENTAEDGTVYGKLENVKVFGIEDDPIDGAVISKYLITEQLALAYHGLSTSLASIQAPGFSLEPSAFDTDMSPAEIMRWICTFGDLEGNPLAWGVEMNDRKRVFLEPADLMTIKYVVLRQSALQAQVTGDLQEAFQKVYGVWTDAQGEVYRTVDRTDEDAMEVLGGYARRRALQVDGTTDEATVLQAVDLYLTENSMPRVTSSFTVRDNVYSSTLAPIGFDEIQAGGMVRLLDFRAREATLTPNDFRQPWTVFQLVGVEVDEDAHSVRLIPAGDRLGFERYMALLSQLGST